MTSLESIVLPLTESRALVERGIVLETTALVWIAEGQLDDEDNEPTIFPRVDALDDEGNPMWNFVSAPVLSELLDAIRAQVGDAEFHSYNVNTVIDIGTRTWELLGDYNDEVGVRGFYRTVERAQAPTDLLAAAALLREIGK